jgi:hypothetical protein
MNFQIVEYWTLDIRYWIFQYWKITKILITAIFIYPSYVTRGKLLCICNALKNVNFSLII